MVVDPPQAGIGVLIGTVERWSYLGKSPGRTPPASCNPEAISVPTTLFNRILWHAMNGSAVPYPKWATREPRAKREE